MATKRVEELPLPLPDIHSCLKTSHPKTNRLPDGGFLATTALAFSLSIDDRPELVTNSASGRRRDPNRRLNHGHADMEEEEDQFARKLFCLRCRTAVPIFSSVSRLSFLQLARERLRGTDGQIEGEGEVVKECQDRIALRPAGAAAAP